MTTLTTRATKGSTLTYNELDANFSRNAQAKSGNYTVAESDNNDTIECTGTITISLPDAATIASASDTGDFEVTIKNVGSGVITIGRITGADTIDGTAADFILNPTQSCTFKVNQAGNGYNIVGSHDSLTKLYDANGNEVVILEGAASAVNEVTILNAATTVNPRIQSSGEANTGLIIADSNDNEVIIAESVASAVNEITITNAASGNKPSINQTGSGDVGLDIEGIEIKNGVIPTATITTLTSTTANITDLILPSSSTSGTGRYIIHKTSIDRSTSSASAVKLYEWNCPVAGTYDVEFTCTATVSGNCRVYINGVATGTNQVFLTGPTTFNEVITFARGDLVQLYLNRGPSGSATITSAYIRSDSAVYLPFIASYGYD